MNGHAVVGETPAMKQYIIIDRQNKGIEVLPKIEIFPS